MLNRRIDEFGLRPSLGYLLSGLILAVSAYLLFTNYDWAEYIFAVAPIPLLLRLTEPNRSRFLHSNFNKNFWKIRLMENLIIISPFLLVLIASMSWIGAGIILSYPLLFLTFKNNSGFSFTIPTPFGRFPFEFPIGFRTSFPVFVLAYFLVFMSVRVDNFNLGLLSLGIVVLTTYSFYSKPEDRYFVWVHAKSPSQFLLHKIQTGVLLASSLTVPILAAMIIAYPEKFWIALIVLTVGLIYLSAMILAKYSAYPNELNIAEGSLIALSLWFPPALLFIIPYFYQKSTKSLSQYLQ